MATNDFITQARLKKLMHYCPNSGALTWIVNKGRAKKGDVVTTRHNGYYTTKIDQCTYLVHRLAWLYMYGCRPTMDIDHINRNKSDNRINNLRDVPRAQNIFNSPARTSSGHSGIYQRGDKWRACIRVNLKLKWLGSFPTIEEAITVREMAEAKYYLPN